MSVISYTYTPKELDPYPSSVETPTETNVVVGGCTFNSLIDHPYKEAFQRFGIPAGLVVSKGGACPLSLTREYRGGMASDIPRLVNDSIYDELFDKVSVSRPKPRRLTRKNKKDA